MIRMTRLCVAIFVDSFEQARRDIATAAEAGADMVELRLDTFPPGDGGELAHRSILPTIITIRAPWEGGRPSTRTDAERVATLQLYSHLAHYTDVELETFKRTPVNRPELTGLIVSSHDFTGRPDRFYNILAELN